jgi:hypothetical protein
MSDTIYFLQIPGAQLESIEQDGDETTLHFSQVQLIQEMEGAFEDSLWTQAIRLTIKGAVMEGDLPECPCGITGGDMTDNIYTYRDHAPLPIDWHGEVSCTFKPDGAGTGFSISGAAMQLEQLEHPRYIKHFKKD